MSGSVVEFTSDNFNKEVIEKKGFTLVDFWAPWCGPCRMMTPIIEEISIENKNIVFGKVNVDENQELSTNYRISSIPCFILFKNGKAIANKTGGCSKDDFNNWLKEQTKINK